MVAAVVANVGKFLAFALDLGAPQLDIMRLTLQLAVFQGIDSPS